jgi:hypothetical protein
MAEKPATSWVIEHPQGKGSAETWSSGQPSVITKEIVDSSASARASGQPWVLSGLAMGSPGLAIRVKLVRPEGASLQIMVRMVWLVDRGGSIT